MSSYIGRISQGGVIVSDAPKITIDEDGLWTLRETRKCDWNILIQSVPRQNSRHPTYPRLVLKESMPSFGRARIGTLELVYRGILPEELPDDVWSIESVNGLEDIRTIENFEELAGTPSEPEDGAIFDDENGLFVGWNQEALAELQGVESFYAPSVSISRIGYVTAATPSGGENVGKIDTPDHPLAAANASGAQNYLKMSFAAEQYGDVWQVRENWLRSADKGWSELIYSASESASE